MNQKEEGSLFGSTHLFVGRLELRLEKKFVIVNRHFNKKKQDLQID